MNRRALLAIAAGSTAMLGGCLDPGSEAGTPTATETATEAQPAETPTDEGQPTGTSTEPDDETPTEPGDGAPTETATGTPGQPRLVDQEMEIQSVECGGSGEGHWEVDVTDGVVTVDGEISGNNACYSARISSAAYDGDEDVLRTTIESYDDSRDGEACMDCTVDVHYRATFTFEDGEPGEVEVQHDGLEG